jgi:hypothetical protein
MNRTILTAAIAALALQAAPAAAQRTADEGPTLRAVHKPVSRHLSGPRFGFTTFTGAIADQRRSAQLETMMTQFGWQFERQIVSQVSGNQLLVEWLFLVGGVEQNEFNLTGSFITGYRLENGLELGVGPSLSFNPQAEKTTTSMVVAGGTTVPFGEFYVPINLAVAIAEGGPRLTTLVGWVIG